MNIPSAEAIQKFCSGCDNLQSDGSCVLDQHAEATRASDVMLGVLQMRFVLSGALRLNIEVPPTMMDDLNMQIGGLTRQERYVARQDCGWAGQNGKKGAMTKDGFIEDGNDQP